MRVLLGLPEILAPRRGERMGAIAEIVEFSRRVAELAKAAADAVMTAREVLIELSRFGPRQHDGLYARSGPTAIRF
jgi:hypothetical protein